MTAPARSVEELIGADRAGLWAAGRAREYTDRDLLSPDAALRWVWAQADAGDPYVLAAPGQVWRLPDGADPDEADAPAPALLVITRHHAPARLRVAYLDESASHSTDFDTVLVDVLHSYVLHTWTWQPDPAADAETAWTCGGEP